MKTLIFKSFNNASVNISRRLNTEIILPTRPYKLYQLQEGPCETTTLSRNDGLDMYRNMYLMRHMEIAAGIMYRSKDIRGFCHLYSGQEAVAAGFYKASRPNDAFMGSYRIHAWALLISNNNVQAILSELTGGKTGISRGKGGSMHMYCANLYGGNGIVGAQVPVGAGIALAHSYAKDGGVCVAMYGDGAANQGQVFEAYNMAKIWNLPCIFLCENNRYAMGTDIRRSCGSTEFYKRAHFIPGIYVDAMEVLTVREAARFAFEYCSSGRGPLVIEANTYRFTGHSMSDPDTTYRTRDEIAETRKTSDPLMLFKRVLIDTGLVTDTEIKEMEALMKKQIEDAVKFSTGEEQVGVEELAFDIYSKNIETELRGAVSGTTWKTGNRPLESLRTVSMSQ